MSYCPNCRQRFEGATECPEHHVALVDELPYQVVDGPSTTWVEIESVGTEEEARLIKGFLDAEGIPCQFESLRIDALPSNMGGMGEIRIYVSAESEQDAINLLRQRTSDLSTAAGDGVITDEGPAMIEDDAQTVAETEE